MLMNGVKEIMVVQEVLLHIHTAM